MSILTVGSIAFDSITTPAGKAERVLGGSASHFSMAASLFVPVSVVAVVGEDFESEQWALFKGRNIDVSGVETKPGLTFAWGGIYSQDFHNRETLFTHLNVFEHFHPVLSEKQKNLPHIFLGNIDPEIQQSVVKQTAHPELICCDTMNYWIDHKKMQLHETLKMVDVLIINDSEILQLAELLDFETAVSKILGMIGQYRKKFPPVLVIKQGEKGAIIFYGQSRFSVPAYRLERIVDPTGAGDSFAGGFVGHLARTSDYSFENFKKALCYGGATASFNLENFGLQDLQRATPEMVEARFATYGL